jgi:iron complex transport system ATP-binding protein
MEKNRNEILSLDSLRIGYISGNSRNVLLAPLYATASKGELIAVIGRNGIGKSTLLRTLTGIQPSIEGSIFISGRDIKDFSRLELAQKVGFISTEIVKITNMTVYELVSLGRFPYTNWIGKIERIDHEIIMDSIMKTGMENLYDRNISELSDGERQRAMIARVLAQDTEIVIMDEPTAFLDIKSKYEIVHLMHDLALKRGKTIIFSTHDLSIAISQADKIWLTLSEKLVQGAPEDLMIQGAFDHLFDSSVVGFNSKDGSFSFRGEERGVFYVGGSGSKRYWTERAVIRAGYRVSKVQQSNIITVPSGDNNKWKCVTSDNKVMEFTSILNLANWLNHEYIQTP